MIGAGGLGDEITHSISWLQVGKGVEAGLAVVILAIVVDRFSKRISQKVDPTA
jgi:glycine betaine/proline transport system permease protein